MLYICISIQIVVKDRIIFFDEGHKYFYWKHQLGSATTEISKYSNEFDSMYQSRCSAYKELIGPEEYLRLRREVFGFNYRPEDSVIFPLFDVICEVENVEEIQNRLLHEWEMAGVNGTAFHRDREAESYLRGFEINPFTGAEFPVRFREKQYDNESWGLDLFSIPDGYYCEFLVFDADSPLESTLCGTIDQLWVETDKKTGVRYTDTGDYKTNSSPPDQKKYNRMYEPFKHLWSNKLTDYTLQASVYQEMLSTHGFTPRESMFTHYTDYDVNQAVEYRLNLLRDEAKLILDIYRKNDKILNFLY